jgi:hypothetical protein
MERGKERWGMELEREGRVGFIYLFLIIFWKGNSLVMYLISSMEYA